MNLQLEEMMRCTITSNNRFCKKWFSLKLFYLLGNNISVNWSWFRTEFRSSFFFEYVVIFKSAWVSLIFYFLQSKLQCHWICSDSPGKHDDLNQKWCKDWLSQIFFFPLFISAVCTDLDMLILISTSTQSFES